MGCASLLSNMTIDSAQYRRRSKNRTADQKKVLDYFVKGGLIPMFTNLKDDAYEAMVMSKRNSLNIKQMALGKIGLDESQVNEIPPVTIEGYVFDDNILDHWEKYGKDGNARSSAYHVTMLFFSDTQVYMYQYIFSMDDDSKRERTEEYFYRDITNFSTSSETKDIPELQGCSGKVTNRNYDVKTFSMVVPGDRFSCASKANIDSQVNAMKAKLREKKMQ